MQLIIRDLIYRSPHKRVQIEERVFEAPKHYFFPVDQVEVDKRPQYLVQSPGWTTPTSGD